MGWTTPVCARFGGLAALFLMAQLLPPYQEGSTNA